MTIIVCNAVFLTIYLEIYEKLAEKETMQFDLNKNKTTYMFSGIFYT